MLNVPAQLAVQASCNRQEVAAATAVYLTVVEIGGAVGSAVSGAVWSKNIPAKLYKYLPEGSKGDVQKIYNSVTVAASYTGAERVAIDRAYQETMHVILVIAICVCVPIALLSLVLKNYRLDEDKNGEGMEVEDMQSKPDEGDKNDGSEEGTKISWWKRRMPSLSLRTVKNES